MHHLTRILTNVFNAAVIGCHRIKFTQIGRYNLNKLLTTDCPKLLSTLPQPERLRKNRRIELIRTVNEEIAKLPPKFAIIHIGGHQYKVTVNDLIVVNQIEAPVGSDIILEKVLMVGSKTFSLIGRPLLSTTLVKVSAVVIERTKAPKIIVFKKKRRKNYKRTKEHQQNISVLRIKDIDLSSNLS